MIPASGITIYRTKEDTDPIVFDLRTINNGTTTKIPSSATVELYLKYENIVTITGTSTTNGIFSFATTSIANADQQYVEFEVKVFADFDFVIGRGIIELSDRLT